jgi:hypothetical protein
MRRARDYAVDGVRPYHSPDRPRVADPVRRRRIAGFLEGGTPVDRILRTDGVWVWPAGFVADVIDRGLAPESELIGHMERSRFTASRPPRDDALDRAVREAVELTRVPMDVSYFVRVDDGFPPDSPLSLLRRVRRPGGETADEALWRDLAWHPTHTFSAHADEYDLREVSEAHAAAVMDHWCAKWHAEWRY